MKYSIDDYILFSYKRKTYRGTIVAVINYYDSKRYKVHYGVNRFAEIDQEEILERLA